VVPGQALVYCSQQAKNAFRAYDFGTNQGFEKWSMSIRVPYNFMRVALGLE
jgi:hypothetical protein